MEPYSTGYVSSSGDTIIPIGKYIYCFTETFDKIAIVVPKNHKGYYAIDRKERLLFEVLGMDNGPDYVENGLFRIKLEGKIGYANLQGSIVIKPQFDFALPFQNGYAVICYGGEDKLLNEYIQHTGGKWGIININGEFVLNPIYDEIKTIAVKDSIKVRKDMLWSTIKLN
jgi:hypothetical protein